jgi:hypothetical protein
MADPQDAFDNRLYINDGTGKFQLASGGPYSGLVNTQTVAFADVNMDGRIDLFVGNVGAADELWLGQISNGTGNFTRVPGDPLGRSGNSTLDTWVGIWGDADGDGAPDLFIGAPDGNSRLMINDGMGAFSEVAAFRGAPTIDGNVRSAAWADLDGDGDLDLFLGTGTPIKVEQDQLWINDGKVVPAFTKVFGVWSTAELITPGVAIADFNGDGTLDVFLQHSSGAGAESDLYMNRGVQGSVANWIPSYEGPASASLDNAPYVSDSAWADVNGDGIPAPHSTTTAPCPITTPSPTPVSLTLHHTLLLCVCVCLRAGILDLFVSRWESTTLGEFSDNQLWLGQGDGTFMAASGPPNPGTGTWSVAWADVDLDGDPDLFLGTSAEDWNYLYLNEGGTFVDWSASFRFGALNRSTVAVAFADIDQDGDEDLFLASGPRNSAYLQDDDLPSELWVNVGGGHFALANNNNSFPAGACCAAWADVDQDGDLDLFVGLGCYLTPEESFLWINGAPSLGRGSNR